MIKTELERILEAELARIEAPLTRRKYYDMAFGGALFGDAWLSFREPSVAVDANPVHEDLMDVNAKLFYLFRRRALFAEFGIQYSVMTQEFHEHASEVADYVIENEMYESESIELYLNLAHVHPSELEVGKGFTELLPLMSVRLEPGSTVAVEGEDLQEEPERTLYGRGLNSIALMNERQMPIRAIVGHIVRFLESYNELNRGDS